ncbi:TPA: hypothetical protein N0F65_005863, partial [Lagenidium giganteum]
HYLSRKKMDPNAIDSVLLIFPQQGCTPLHHAALMGFHEILCALIASGADIHATTTDGNSTLHKAARGGHLNCVQELIRKNADPMVINARGETPLAIAAWLKHSQVTAFLKPLSVEAADPVKADRK